MAEKVRLSNMVIIKIILFHLLYCLLGMCVVAFNLTFTTHINMQTVLYTIFSVFVIISYFWFGYKFDNKGLKFHVQIWILSVILVGISFMDVKTATLLNLPFQPLASLFYHNSQTQEIACIITSLLPSALIQSGYIYKERNSEK